MLMLSDQSQHLTGARHVTEQSRGRIAQRLRLLGFTLPNFMFLLLPHNLAVLASFFRAQLSADLTAA